MKTLMTLTLALAATSSMALTTVATVGQTQPLFKTQAVKATPNQEQIKKIVQESINQRYYVKTPSLSVGHVIEEAKPFKLESPIAIIGCDRESALWLRHYAKRLMSMGATGFVVNCNGKDQYQVLKAQSTIPLVPTSGSEFAKRFGINHYPVLITQGGIFQ